MGISRYGLRTSKSLSPLTMQSAFPLIASERNLSSRGSRHTLTVSVICTSSASRSNAARNSTRRDSVVYFSNSARRNTSFNSSITSSETSNMPPCFALSNAWRGFDFGRRTALKIAFVSKTNLPGIENGLQFFFR